MKANATHNSKGITDEQIIDCLKRGLNHSQAAEELGCSRHNIRNRKAKLIRQGLWQHGNGNDAVPEPYYVKGKSQYYDKDGKPAGVWVKSDIDKERWFEIAEQAAKDFYKDLPPIDPPKAPRNFSTDIIPWFQIGDGHLGMLAHGDEVGASFDLKIAEADLCKAMATLIDRSPKCERCVIHDLGDMTHYESFDGITLASHHSLDYDTRYPKMIQVYIRVMRFIIERALSKFKHVDVIINQGNHSRSNDIWMRELLNTAYGHTGRVHALNNESVFIPYRMGNTFVLCHHSDKCKPKQLAHVMATDFNQDWGESTYRYIDIGHIHHSMSSKEHPGVKVESWNQLATTDKYAHDGGWRSRSCLSVVYRSKTYGEKGRETITLEEVRDILQSAVSGKNVGIRRKVYTV